MDKEDRLKKSSKKGFEHFGAPTFMSAWVLLLDDKESIHEGCERTRSIARRRASSAFNHCFGSADIYVGMGLLKNLSTCEYRNRGIFRGRSTKGSS